MIRRLLSTYLVITVACVGARHPATTPIFTQGPWRIRLDVDSAPSRRAPTQPIYGVIDFAKGHYTIDLFRALGRHGIADTVRMVIVPPIDVADDPRYRIILGDATSFDDKVVLDARAVTADSLVGTWSETILCCSAAGRFTLWRSTTKS